MKSKLQEAIDILESLCSTLSSHEAFLSLSLRHALKLLKESRYEGDAPPPTEIDWSDPDILSKVCRRDGTDHDYLRVLCTDAPGEYPVVLLANDGWGRAMALMSNGRFDSDREYAEDLILKPLKRVRKTVYVNSKNLGSSVDVLFCLRDASPVCSSYYDSPVTIEYDA